MKSAIGKMIFKDRQFTMCGEAGWSDFEVHSISATRNGYAGLKTDGSRFHCNSNYWGYEAYSAPRVNSVLPKTGLNCLMNFYDRSGDNWKEVEILFVGEKLFVYKIDGFEHSAYIAGERFRVVETKP